MLRAASIIALSQVTAALDSNGAPIAPDANGRVKILVTLKGKDEKSSISGDRASNMNNFNADDWETRGERGQAVEKLLQNEAEESQKSLMNFLNEKDGNGRRLLGHSGVKSYWISNQILIEGASEDMIQELEKRNDVVSASIELEYPIEEPTEISDEETGTNSLQWGVQRVRANSIWNQFTGKGVVVGGIDTGVRGTHRILKNNFLGKYGWYDPYQKSKYPNDEGGHGTHTMGSIVGAEGYGVAPGAKWMACKGCATRSCSQSALLACGQFFLCPTDTYGNNRDCSKAPDVINNSWGGGRGSTWYSRVVNAWRAAGIIPVFSAGNSGSSCNTANSPGDYYNVISVSSIQRDGAISSFSSRGRTVDIAAPGSSVRSAFISSDNSFATYSGTSMAAPHVTGVIAIMLQKNSALTYDSVMNIFKSSGNKYIKASSQVCGGKSQRQFPNDAFGYGVVDAVAAVAQVPGSCRWVDNVGCSPTNSCYWSWSWWQCVSYNR